MLNAEEMANLMIDLYRRSENKTKGKYLLSVEQFKTLSGRIALHDAYILKVAKCLLVEGFVLINLRDVTDGVVAVIAVSTIMKRFQELEDDLIQEFVHTPEYDDDEW